MNRLTGIETARKDRIVGLFSQAHKLAISGDYKTALEFYDRIVTDVPDFAAKIPQINYERAICLRAMGQVDQAEQAIKSCLQIGTDDLSAQELLIEIQSERYKKYYEQLCREITGTDSSHKTLNFTRFSMNLDLTDKGSIYTAACQQANLLEPFELSVFSEMVCRNPDNLIIDIGANYGLYTLHACDLARHNIVRKIVAVEPDKRVFTKLGESVRENGFEKDVILINKAISDSDGQKVELFVNTRGSVDNRTFVNGGIKYDNSYYVETVTIDSIIAQIEDNCFKPDSVIIKIDIQGNEPLAIRGMVKTLSVCPSIALFLELDPRMMESAGFDTNEFAYELFTTGFDKIINIDETGHLLQPLYSVEDLIQIIRQGKCMHDNDPRRYSNILCSRQMSGPIIPNATSRTASINRPHKQARSVLHLHQSVTESGGTGCPSGLDNKNDKEITMNVVKYCPETCIVLVSYGRPEIAARSYNSLVSAIEPYRDRVRIIISDATDDEQKMMWARSTNADDVILTPRFTPAATSRNLATTLILNKYSPRYLCMVEDDFEYDAEWYPSLIEATGRLYGVMSPFDLAYGIFSACDHQIPPDRKREDKRNNVTAYIFGAVAYQRFVLTSHYLAVMRCWDADLLGISYAQTGGQTFRNVMRGFCGAILPGRLSWPIDEVKNLSTWQAKRPPGPPAHSFNLRDYDVIAEKTREAGVYQLNEK